MTEHIVEADHYIDDTVQLEHIDADMEEDSYNEFGPIDDRVMIIPGQEHGITDSTIEVGRRPHVTPEKIPWRHKASVGVLTLINLLNYMDRFTIAGKSPKS